MRRNSASHAWRQSRRLLPLMMCVVLLVACSGADARKARYLEKAQELVAEQDFDKAQLELRNALQIDPHYVDAQLLLAEVAEKVGDPRRALQMYQSALEQSPTNGKARTGLARLYVFGGLPEKGIEIAEAGLTATPDDPDLLVVRGMAKASMGDIAGATVDAEQAIAKQPNHESGVALLASLYLRKDRVDDARTMVEAATSKAPKNTDLRFVLADIYVRSDRPRDAERVLREIVAIQPAQLAHRNRLARFLMVEGRRDDAEKVLREAVAQNPESLEAKSALITFLASGASFEIAEKSLLQFVQATPKDQDLRLLLGDFYARRGKWPQAQSVYQEIVKLDGTGAQGLAARNRMALQASSEKRLDEVSRLVEEVLAANPQDNDALILRADLALAKGDSAAAIADLRAVLRDQPTAVPVQRALAQAYTRSNDLALAEETLNRALELSPGDPQLQVDLAQFLARSGHPDRAVQSLQKAVAEAPDNLAAQEQLFLLYFQQEDFAKARETAKSVQQARPDTPQGSYLAGLVDRAEGKNADAQAAFEAALKLKPTAVEPLQALVDLLVSEKRGDVALAKVADVVKNQPKNPVARNMQGDLLLTSGRSADALKAFDAAIGLAPKWWVPYRGKALAELKSAAGVEAEKTLLRGIEATDGAPTLVVDLATIYERSGRADEAIKMYDTLLKQAPTSDLLANNLAMLLSTYRSDAQSLERARQLSDKFRDSQAAAYVNTSGWVAYRQGRYDEAVALLQRASEKEPKSALMRYQLALAQIKTGKVDEARSNLESVVKLDGQSRLADQAQQQLEQLRRS